MESDVLDYIPPSGSLVCIDSHIWQVGSVIYYPEQGIIYVNVIEEQTPIARKSAIPIRQSLPDNGIINTQQRQDRLEKKARRVFAEVATLKKQTAIKSKDNNGTR